MLSSVIRPILRFCCSVSHVHVLCFFRCVLQVTADVWRIHSGPEGEPVVLFQRGGVRLLDALLSAPQQAIEEVLTDEEVIRSDICLIMHIMPGRLNLPQ